jgi:hypothetical protein
VAISRTSGAAPKFFLSHDCGNTWYNTGNVFNGTANNVSPWLQKINDTTLTYLFADRNTGAMFLRGAEYKVSYLDTAISSTASQNGLYRQLNIAEPILNNRTNTANYGGHFGYPSISYVNGEWVVIYNDLYVFQPSPYGGSDPVTISLITMPLKGRVLMKAYNSATQSFPTDVETRWILNSTYVDNWGVLDANYNITIPKDGYYRLALSTSLGATNNGRRILVVRKIDPNDTTTTTNRKIIVYKEYIAYAGYFGYNQTVDGNAFYYFNKGDVIKTSMLIYGAGGNVSTVYTQLPGGSNEGIYANYVELEEMKRE